MKRSDTPKPLPKHRRDMKRSDTLKTLNPELTFGTGSYYKTVPKVPRPADARAPHVEAPLIPVRQEPVPKGEAFVPGLLYRLLNRSKRPYRTDIDVRFSTSAPPYTPPPYISAQPHVSHRSMTPVTCRRNL